MRFTIYEFFSTPPVSKHYMISGKLVSVGGKMAGALVSNAGTGGTRNKLKFVTLRTVN